MSWEVGIATNEELIDFTRTTGNTVIWGKLKERRKSVTSFTDGFSLMKCQYDAFSDLTTDYIEYSIGN